MDGRVGVLLPDTDEAGAWKVASDVCDAYDLGNHRPDCQVHLYPDRQDGTWGDVEHRDGQPVGAGEF